MGFDKPDLGFVVHLGAPSSPVAYYQQVGRAGRATERRRRAAAARAGGPRHLALLRDRVDARARSRPRPCSTRCAERRPGGRCRRPALETVVDVRRTRLELLLKVLDVDGAVQRVQGGWAATGRPWAYDAERYARVAAAREAEQQLDARRTSAPTRLPDAVPRRSPSTTPTAAACGRCDRCAGPWYPTDVPDSARAAAAGQPEPGGRRARRRGRSGRAAWTGSGVPVKGRIPAGEQVGAGRAVARLTDLGWGQRLRALLAEGAPTPPPTPRCWPPASRAEEWGWERRPVAVATVPSRSRPLLVAQRGRASRQLGRLAWLGPLEPAGEGPRGRPGGNSAFRLAGVWDAFAPSAQQLRALPGLDGPVLLVDDLAVPVDPHGRRAGPAPGRRRRRSAVRAGGDGVRRPAQSIRRRGPGCW